MKQDDQLILKEQRSGLSVLGFFSSIRLVIVLIVIVGVFTILNRSYFSVNSFYSILMSVTVIGLACIGQSFCLLTGGFDLSVGATVLMSGVTAAYLIRNFGISIWLAFIIAIVQGFIIGLLNGLIIIKGRINPLITTLAMFYILTGLIFFFTQGTFVNVREESFRFLGTYRIFGTKFLQLPIIILVALFVISLIILKYSRFGKYIYIIGGNKVAARFSGINTDLYGISVYVISGAVSALGGFIYASRVGAAQPTIGGNFALMSIAAVILGGISLAGGRGSVMGSFVGILIIQGLNNGLLGMGLETHYQDIATGLVLIIAVFIDVFRKK